MHFLLRNKYPIETEEQVKTASAFVRDHLQRFDPSDRVAAAYRLEKRASQLGMAIDEPWVANYGRFVNAEVQYSPEFSTAMAMRKTACLDRIVAIGDGTSQASDVVDAMEKCAGRIHPHDLAAMIYEFDKVAGLDLDYDTRIPDPVFTVCGCTTDPYYDQVKIAGIPEARFKTLFTAEAMTKMASVIGDDQTQAVARNPVDFFAKNPLLKSYVCGVVNG